MTKNSVAWCCKAGIPFKSINIISYVNRLKNKAIFRYLF